MFADSIYPKLLKCTKIGNQVFAQLPKFPIRYNNEKQKEKTNISNGLIQCVLAWLKTVSK